MNTNMGISAWRGKLKLFSLWFLLLLGFLCSSCAGWAWKMGTYSERRTKKSQAKPRVYNQNERN